MIKYRARLGKIEAIEVVRETAKQVVYLTSINSETRESKKTEWYSWHDTWDEAHAAIVEEEEIKVSRAKLSLEMHEGRLAAAKRMTNPWPGAA